MPMSVVVLGEPVRGTSIEILNGVSSTLTASNVGSGFGVYKQQLGGNLEFKSLVAGSGISIVSNTNDLTLSAIPAAPAIVGNSKAVVSDGTGNLIASSTTATQIGYLNTLTSNVQTQFGNLASSIVLKQDIITGGASTVTSANLSANQVLVSDASGKISISSVTSTQLGYLTGVTDYVQNQINAITSSISGFVREPMTFNLHTNGYTIQARSGIDSTYADINPRSIEGYDRYAINLQSGGFYSAGGTGTFIGGISTDNSVYYKTVTIPIGDWNMDSTSTVFVSTGSINQLNIVSVAAIIRNDASDAYYPIPYFNVSEVLNLRMGGITYLGIPLIRTAAGFFDSTDFDSTSYNRGWVTITYKN